jgi:hypothetical protein
MRLKTTKYNFFIPFLNTLDFYLKIDNFCYLITHSPSPLAEVRIPHGQNLNFNLLLFYAHCVAFELESPVFIYVLNSRKFLSLRPLIKNINNQNYYDDMAAIFDGLCSFKFGKGQLVSRHTIWREDNLDTKKYKKVAKELQLYNEALMQINPLYEFLDYCRIIESVNKQNNFKNWLENNINRILSYKPEKNLSLQTPFITNKELKNKCYNLFSVYKRKAKIRFYQLLKQYKTKKEIAKYLYNETRCGIVHGWKIKTFESDSSKISQDNYIMKLLARIAIKDKIGNN